MKRKSTTKVDWHYLCLKMMIDYIPNEIDTMDDYDKFQDVCDHFISLSKVLINRTKSERNLNSVMIDENEDIEKIAKMMRRVSRQTLEYAKSQREETILTATSALQKYEGILASRQLNNSQQAILEYKINELRDVLETL